MTDGVRRLSRGLRRLATYWWWNRYPPKQVYVTFGEFCAIKETINDDLGCDFGMINGTMHFQRIPVLIGTDAQVDAQRTTKPEHQDAMKMIAADFAGAV